MGKQQDVVLDRKIEHLHLEIESWARKHDLWWDCDFFDYTERVKPIQWDKTGYITVLAAEGPLSSIAISREYMGFAEGRRLSKEFDQILGPVDICLDRWL